MGMQGQMIGFLHIIVTRDVVDMGMGVEQQHGFKTLCFNVRREFFLLRRVIHSRVNDGTFARAVA